MTAIDRDAALACVQSPNGMIEHALVRIRSEIMALPPSPPDPVTAEAVALAEAVEAYFDMVACSREGLNGGFGFRAQDEAWDLAQGPGAQAVQDLAAAYSAAKEAADVE